MRLQGEQQRQLLVRQHNLLDQQGPGREDDQPGSPGFKDHQGGKGDSFRGSGCSLQLSSKQQLHHERRVDQRIL